MTYTYAIADLHGRSDLLLKALNAIRDYDAGIGSPGGTIVTTGDYVDRGPDSKGVIETLMGGLDPVFGQGHGFKLVCLSGNHEEIMLAGCFAAGLAGSWWLPNGGGATLISYGQKEGERADTTVVPREHLAWVARLPLTHVDRHRVFVHAGLQKGVPLEKQDTQKLTWMLYPDGAEDGFGDLHVVHGHHQNEDGPVLLRGRSNFDTMAWWTGRLVVGVFNDAVAGGPIDTLEIIGLSHTDMLLLQEAA